MKVKELIEKLSKLPDVDVTVIDIDGYPDTVETVELIEKNANNNNKKEDYVVITNY